MAGRPGRFSQLAMRRGEATPRTWLSCRRRGVSLAELVAAMLILGVIGGVGTQSFLLVADVSDQMRARARAVRTVRLIVEEIRRDCVNLSPIEVGGASPYEMFLRPEGESLGRRLLVQMGEAEPGEAAKGAAWVWAVEYWLEPGLDGTYSLVRVVEPFGVGGVVGEKRRGILGDRLTAFSLEPLFDSDSGPGAGPGGNAAIRAFRLHIDAEIPNEPPLTTSILLMVGALGEKKDEG